MENHDGIRRTSPPPNDHARVAWKGAAIMVGVIVGFYILREHWGHVLGIAPYLLLLACPLMHVFMYGGHGHQHNGDSKDSR